MKTKNILTLFVAILLTTTLLSLGAQTASAQGCTDATGASIPCPPGDDPDTDREEEITPIFRFLSNNDNYLDPANWNKGGHIPGVGETALLDGATAVIDPRDSTPIQLGNLTLRNGAHLIARDGVMTANIVDACDPNAALDLYNFDLKADIVYYGGLGGIRFNPSFLEADRIVVCDPETTSGFGLGGVKPTDHDGRGPDHYAHMQGRSIDLDGELDLFSVYDFYPEPGDSFEIITNTGGELINGEFANAPEGEIVGGFCDVGLRITYQGGDGNDVVLTAEKVVDPDPEWTCDANAAGGDWFDPASWEDARVPDQGDRVIINGKDVEMVPANPVTPIALDELIIDDSVLTVRNAILHVPLLDSTTSHLNFYCSEIYTKTFIDPWTLGGSGSTRLNPSYLESDTFVLEGAGISFVVGLGGSKQASRGAICEGHYAHVNTDSAQLDGELEVAFMYGFRPNPGDQFEIISITDDQTGEFVNAGEGDLIGYCDMGFRVSYQGGDGNDVVLTAEDVAAPNPDWPCDANAAGGDWFDSASWNDGRVPDRGDRVMITDKDVDITPAEDSTSIELDELIVQDSVLNVHNTTLYATVLDSTTSEVNFYCSEVYTGPFIDPWTLGSRGSTRLNPSYLESDIFILEGSGVALQVGLGGAEQAGPDAICEGHYAHVNTDIAHLDGNLEIFFMYDFIPQIGQQFEIITVNNADGLRGEFVNAPEGSVVGGYCDTALTISYVGGDGNDVVLMAEKASSPDPAWNCDTQTAGESDVSPEAEAQEPSTVEKNTLLVILVGVVGLIILLVIFMRKKKTT